MHAADCDMGALDDQLQQLLNRAYEIAASQLEGINEAALELAALVGDRRVIERAVRVLAERVHEHPTRANKQVASLIAVRSSLACRGGTGQHQTGPLMNASHSNAITSPRQCPPLNDMS